MIYHQKGTATPISMVIAEGGFLEPAQLLRKRKRMEGSRSIRDILLQRVFK